MRNHISTKEIYANFVAWILCIEKSRIQNLRVSQGLTSSWDPAIVAMSRLQLLALPLACLGVLEGESTGPLVRPSPLANVATRAEHKTPQAKRGHEA